MKDSSKDLDTCGCCERNAPISEHGNPPGKESLNYRMKVHSTFFKDMISRLSQRQALFGNGDEKNPLLSLCTRKRDDPTIALMDAWAAVGDVLTFYQERICNEGFLRTAKEPRSVLELTRSIGYELSPGASAGTCLSFMVEDSPGAPEEVIIPKGTKVESIPGPGELPQIFETISDFTARSSWNEMRPRLSRPQPLDPLAPRAYIQGMEDIKAGDWVLFVGEHVFSWDEIPGDDTARLLEFLERNFNIEWVKTAEIEKIDSDSTIRISGNGNYLSLKINDSETEVILEIDGTIANKLIAKQENDRINIYAYFIKDKIMPTAKKVLSAIKEPKLNRTRLELDNPEKAVTAKDMNISAQNMLAERAPPEFTPARTIPYMQNRDLNRENVNKVIGEGHVWRENDLASAISIFKWDSLSIAEHIGKIRGKAPSETRQRRIPGPDSNLSSRQRGFGDAQEGDNLEEGNNAESPADILNVDPGLYAFKVRSNPFGHNAPRWDSLPDNLRYRTFYGPKPPYPNSWDGPKEPSITVDSKGKEHPDAHFFFERSLPEVVPADWVLLVGWAKEVQASDSLKGTFKADLSGNVMEMRLTGTIKDASGLTKAIVDAAANGIVKGKADGKLEGSVEGVLKAKDEAEKEDEADKEDIFKRAYRVSKVTERTLADYSLTGKATGVTVTETAEDGIDVKESLSKFKMRNTTIFAASQRLELTEISIEDPASQGQKSLELNGLIRNLQRGQHLVITGELKDLEGVTASEVVTLSSEAEHENGFTTIYFEQGLKNSYKIDTIKINANVVYADHGETTTEVLGSGSGSLVNQEFILKNKPLTYVSTSTPGGRDAAIKIEVDAVMWKECSSFLDQENLREKYIIRIDHDHRAHIIFGDGEKGARLPTGVENVVAEYRSGIGKSGMLAADKLTLLKTRPHGIRSVSNPMATSGGQEPEDMYQAKINAPLRALNVDRIVSLKDFEDFALNFPGIGKAQAIMLLRGQQNLVHITVATALPALEDKVEVEALASHVLDGASKLYRDLAEAISRAGDSVQPFIVNSYEPSFFNLKANVWIEKNYKTEIISQKIKEELQSAFSFQKRDFGQPVASSEVIGIIQNLEGVAAVELDKFYRFLEDPGYNPNPILEAGCVQLDGDQIKKAELLLINPKGIELEVIEL
ncbi:MAG: hypothetical protein PHW87_00595 [Methanothrix sp.]|nr:hypothetical protein [Methanothrix sp.]